MKFSRLTTSFNADCPSIKFGTAEEKKVLEVIRSGHLFSAHGNRVTKLAERIADEYNVLSCTMVSSGTAAIHVGLGAVGVDFGDEVITPPITDTGTVIPILLQGAVPIFADIDKNNLNISPQSIEEKITSRTRAILVVHYAGYPSDMGAIMKIARKNDLLVVEDCCQALGATYRGKRVGTIGDVGCYSTNDTKPISCGDGGFVLTKDEKIAERARLFHDKGFDRKAEIRNPKFLAPNYRLTELQAAVLEAQFDSFQLRLAKRQHYGALLDSFITDSKQLRTQIGIAGAKSGYFDWPVFLEKLEISVLDFCSELKRQGIRCSPYSLYNVMYKLDFLTKNPPNFFKFLSPIPNYGEVSCPVAEQVLVRHARIHFSEFDPPTYIEHITNSIGKIAAD